MRRGIHQFGVGLVLLLAAASILQLDGAAGLQAAGAAPPVETVGPHLVGAQAERGGREYFVSRKVREIVPIGAPTLTMPILMYHYVRTPPSILTDLMGYKLSVSPEDFAAQMDWLAVNRYHPVDFNDVRAYFAGTTPLPSRPVVITFDDGYQDLYSTAFPILATHRFKAVAYIVSGFVGQSRYVSKEQVVEMDRNGIQIASHTVDHPNLARASFGSTMYQLVESKRWLEQLVGHPVVDFAYPSGRSSAVVVSALGFAGYDTAVTEQVSLSHSRSDRFMWTRVRVGGGESLADFIAGLGASMPSVKVVDRQVKLSGERTPPQASG
jgi:peptidoglycan/xylan/chitin deacetylase (PgdA/CDA1 family)